MRFTELGVGHLEYKARTIHGLVVENEPNWLELCSSATADESIPAGPEPGDGTDSDDDPEADPDCYTF